MRWLILSLLLLTTSCSRNPVTGKNELTVVSEQQEIAIGTEIYPLLQQVEGGPYLVDLKVQGYVDHVGTKLARVSDRPQLPYEFIVLDNSIPNAWSLPGGKIGINRGLLDKLGSEAELAAVLSHEIVHSAARHSAAAMERNMLLQNGLSALSSAVSGSSYEDLVMGSASVGTNLIDMKYSRSAESEADFYGMKYMSAAGYDPEAAVDLQRTFVKLQEGHSQNWLDGLFASHPPTEERIAANQQTATLLPPGGERGKEAYAEAMKTLLDDIPAYEALDAGYKQLYLSHNPEAALKRADEGIAIEPLEAHLYNLKGKAERSLGKNQDALTSFIKATDLNNRYFDFPLQRGLMEYELNNYPAARRALEGSVALLPTSEGHYTLGKIATSEGRMSDAFYHFRMAQDCPSGLGGRTAITPESNAPFDGIVEASVTISGIDGVMSFHFLNRSTHFISYVTVEVTFYGEKGEKKVVIGRKQVKLHVKVGPGNYVTKRTGMTAPAGTDYAEVVVLNAKT